MFFGKLERRSQPLNADVTGTDDGYHSLRRSGWEMNVEKTEIIANPSRFYVEKLLRGRAKETAIGDERRRRDA